MLAADIHEKSIFSARFKISLLVADIPGTLPDRFDFWILLIGRQALSVGFLNNWLG
jgi:hypothetical protein